MEGNSTFSMPDKLRRKRWFSDATYRVCTVCGLLWNVSSARPPLDGKYICPHCTSRLIYEQKREVRYA